MKKDLWGRFSVGKSCVFSENTAFSLKNTEKFNKTAFL